MRIDDSFFAANRLSTPIQEPKAENNNTDITGGFKNILDDLMEASRDASAASRVETAKMITGQMEDFPKYMVTGEKSGILFELNQTVRNKVIDAYQEIMRTQV